MLFLISNRLGTNKLCLMDHCDYSVFTNNKTKNSASYKIKLPTQYKPRKFNLIPINSNNLNNKGKAILRRQTSVTKQ